MSRPWLIELLHHRLVQPDQRSCGAASLVVARAATDPAYAQLLTHGVHPGTGWQLPGSTGDRFRAETLAMHARVTGLADRRGRLQPPWPRALGTPPWAVARQLSSPALPYVVRRSGRRPAVVQALRDQVAAGRPLALYVGNATGPRHVVLALDTTTEGLAVYDPATGRVGEVTTDQLIGHDLPFGRWRRWWLVVAPADQRDATR